MGFSLFGDSGDKKVEETTNIEEKPINITDQRAAREGAFIGGNVTPTAEEIDGDFNVTVTDSGAFRLVGDALEDFSEISGQAVAGVVAGQRDALDFGSEALVSTQEINEQVLEDQSDLVNDVLQRESILTAQTLSKLGSSFDQTTDVLEGQQAELAAVTGSLSEARSDRVAGGNNAQLALILVAGVGIILLMGKKR